MNVKPVNYRHWDEPMFQLLSRVIDAVTYDLRPGMRTMLVAEYLAQTSRAEIAVLMRRRRRTSKRPSRPMKPNKR